MEITSVKSEEQDEIGEILLSISGNEAVDRGELDEYISKLAKFSKNELGRKKVDVEYRIATKSSISAFLGSILPLLIIAWVFIDPKHINLQVSGAIVSFLFGWLWHGKDSWMRNNRLYALKIALIEKEGVE